MDRAKLAEDYFKAGYNCAQSVAMAFADLAKVDKEVLAKTAVCFGGGTGRMRLTCGALNGGLMVLGAIYSSSDGNAENKNKMYVRTQEVAKEFERRNGSINCGQLLSGKGLQADTTPKAEERTESYYKKRPCVALVRSMAEILSEYLQKDKIEEK